jgi:hypothetical protein
MVTRYYKPFSEEFRWWRFYNEGTSYEGIESHKPYEDARILIDTNRYHARQLGDKAAPAWPWGLDRAS